jgi:hypothetical protein
MRELCPIWKTTAKIVARKNDVSTFSSSRTGGLFEITDSAIAMIGEDFPGWKKIAVSEEIFLANMRKSIPRIDSLYLDNLQPPTVLSVSRSFDRFFNALVSVYPRIGQLFDYLSIFNGEDRKFAGKNEYFFLAAINAPGFNSHENSDNLRLLLDAALDRGFLQRVDPEHDDRMRLTTAGWEHIESLGLSIGTGNQIFVAMWFGSSELRDFYNNGIKPAVEGAGYNCVRIDDTEHNRKIDDQIIAEIRKSKALIADITCGLSRPEGGWGKSQIVGAPRGGVYFEAGFAAGINIPVIWTVKQSVADIENVTHFDVRQFNQIRWDEDHPEFVRRLKNRIEATIGRGTR